MKYVFAKKSTRYTYIHTFFQDGLKTAGNIT